VGGANHLDRVRDGTLADLAIERAAGAPVTPASDLQYLTRPTVLLGVAGRPLGQEQSEAAQRDHGCPLSPLMVVGQAISRRMSSDLGAANDNTREWMICASNRPELT